MSGFLDTNILFYSTTDDPRGAAAKRLVAEGHGIAVQSLNEFALSTRRRLGRSWQEVEDAIAWFLVCCPPPIALTLSVHETGITLARRYQLKIYDAMIVAAAIESGADTLWSEDMHDGLVVGGRLTIRNPF